MIGSEGTLGFISEITYLTVEEHAHKASALILFDHLETACSAVTRLKQTPVAAVELLDRASLRSVQDKPGMPGSLRSLPEDGAALLVETRAGTAAALAIKIELIAAQLSSLPLATPLRFTTDAAESAALWNVRKGMFPAIGAMRPTGTTVIIEDVAFPVERLAEATLALQRLLRRHGYDEAIIYGHALEGNLHFVFTQDFGRAAEVERYSRFMDELCALVVNDFDGSLKAEHGTGRNMAPFVELEWGAQAFAAMRRIKALFDPQGLLNPGVILNDDPKSHLKNLKPLPAADPLVDKCIECGFCEPKCPSRGLTLSPRQRIVGWREIARLDADGSDAARSADLKQLYDYHGIETCAACGLCATACPVGIETGLLIKALRGRKASPLARQMAGVAARQYGALTTGVRWGLGAADLLHGVVGTRAMQGTLDGLRHASGGRLPKWSPTLARPIRFVAPPARAASGDRIVYFPSCAARNMGPQRGHDGVEMLPAVAARLFERAGFDVVYPAGLDGLCCGQPFESKGLVDAADSKSAELEAALADASEGGRWPIVFDTSPCAYRMKKFLAGRLAVQDSIDFVHDSVLARVEITARPEAVAVHPVCSVRKMGSVDKLMAVAARCSRDVVTTEDVQCCGFAGDRGFIRPELNEHALRHLKASLPAGCASGYSSSRTCEIGLSEQAGFPYQSILYLVERCASSRSATGAIATGVDGDGDARRARDHRLGDQLGDVARCRRARRIERAQPVADHHRAIGAGGGDRSRRRRERLLDAQHVDSRADGFVDPHAAAAGAAAHRLLAGERELERRVAAEARQDRARRVELAVVAAEVAGVVVDHAFERRVDLDPAVGEQLGDELGVVNDLAVQAELGILVAQRVEGVRVAGDDALDAELAERLRQRRRELLEQHLVADPSHAFAGRSLACAEDAEAHPRLLKDADEGARDLLAARVERHRRADVEQAVDPGNVGGAGDHRHAEALGPVAAVAGRQAPRIALRFVGLEHPLQLVRELARDHHLVLAHAKELVEVLELDRARRLAVAAGRAGPERLRADHRVDQRRQLVLRVAGDDQLAALDQVVLQAVVDRLQRERLAGEVGRAGVLAAAAFGAGERIETVLPGEVGGAAHARLHVGLVGRLHELVEVDAGNAMAGPAAPEVQRGQGRDDVEMLARRQDDEEREHHHHLRPVGEHVAPLQRRRRERREGVGEGTAAERERALVRDRRHALGEQREAEAVEREVGGHDGEDQREHEHGLAIALEPPRVRDEAPVQGIEHRRDHGDLDDVLEHRERSAEGGGIRRRLAIADRDELELAQQERDETEEEDGVHQARAPLAPDHALLHQAVDDDAAQPLPGMVAPILGLQREHDAQLAPGEPGEAGEGQQHQQADPGRTHRCLLKGVARNEPARVRASRAGTSCRAVSPTVRSAPATRLI